jgi:hypothetical protein
LTWCIANSWRASARTPGSCVAMSFGTTSTPSAGAVYRGCQHPGAMVRIPPRNEPPPAPALGGLKVHSGNGLCERETSRTKRVGAGPTKAGDALGWAGPRCESHGDTNRGMARVQRSKRRRRTSGNPGRVRWASWRPGRESSWVAALGAASPGAVLCAKGRARPASTLGRMETIDLGTRRLPQEGAEARLISGCPVGRPCPQSVDGCGGQRPVQVACHPM